MKKGLFIFLVWTLVVVSGCQPPSPTALPVFTMDPNGVIASGVPAAVATPSTPAPTSLPVVKTLPEITFSPAVPERLRKMTRLPDGFKVVPASGDSVYQVVVSNDPKMGSSRWVYALAVPFPTIIDGISLGEIREAWRGKPGAVFAGHPLLLADPVRAAFEKIWGPASADGVKVLPAADLLDYAWKNPPGITLIGFEDLEPRWKTLSVDGMNPLDNEMDLAKYPLVIGFAVQDSMGNPIQKEVKGKDVPTIPAGNRDTARMTTLVMTGTTAMVRQMAVVMEEKGIEYPARDIKTWLRTADLTHISNEVPFDPDCPPGKPLRTDWQFCTPLRYFDLLKAVGADIIELTGNHEMDRGSVVFLKTLDLYEQNQMAVYGGGRNLQDARKALLVEDHGNRLAFLGCNVPGPDYDWATSDQPGAAPCDREWMKTEIEKLKKQGYIVIVTFQHLEEYTYVPLPPQRGDFTRMAEAGADIVSGSQSHFPQGFGFIKSSFMHYGLGNLFFDQMDRPVVGTRREFIDRHIFYDGRYIQTQILTAMLEDYSRPRPMTAEERTVLLQDAFKGSGW